jgi:uncharacterized protein YrrD
MTSFRNTRGIPVVAKSSAEQVGKVKHFVVDDGRIQALHIDGGKKHGQLVSWSDVAAFGDDAVIITDDGVARDASDDRENRALRDELVMLDKRVLDDVGDEHGSVADVAFDPADGTIESLTIGDGEVVEGDRLLGVGAYAVMVAGPEDA